MFRLIVLVSVAVLAATGCHREPQPVMAGSEELPPLPPSSGTPIGYLLDNATQLQLSDDQMTKLRQLDNSLSARNEGIDTQLREIERPMEEEPPEKGEPPPRVNNAPGAAPMHTTPDAAKLHEAKAANSRDALEKAFALLDDNQRETARKLLDDRGIEAPKMSAGTAMPAPEPQPSDTAVPLEP
ncbi:MAG: hypothetical protein AB7P03_30060 [Kofleriaceae bacterium]